MRTLRKIFERPSRKLLWLANAAVLLSTAGCSLLQNEDEGDPEPNVGEFRISVSPTSFTVPLTTDQGSVDMLVRLSAKCDALFPPSPCAPVVPSWHWSYHSRGPMTVEMSNDQSLTDGRAYIYFDVRTYLAGNSPRISSLPGGDSQLFEFFPSSLPKDMVLSGNRLVTVKLTAPTSSGERQEQPSNKPRLVVFPYNLPIPITNPSCSVEVTYEGPMTTLSKEVTDSGADQFEVTAAGPGDGFPYPLSGDGKPQSLRVTYKGGQGKATLTLRTGAVAGAPNGCSYKVTLRGM